MREGQEDLSGAIGLYMKAGLPAKAAHLIMQHEVGRSISLTIDDVGYIQKQSQAQTLTGIFCIQELSSQPELLQQIASALVKASLYEKGGSLYEQAHSYQQAMEAYRQGGAFRRAVELARVAYPNEVVGLEEQWGDHLCVQKQYDAAIMHYIEAG